MGWWQVLMSTLAAAFGVQTEQARRRDFTQGSPWLFIAAGVAFTLVFILVLVLIVRVVLASAGA
ncbi:DUF2970 domain-containing protein [Alkalilimnicola ehrlichii MLHE-1]|nr:DUF2970 domain-containing protein [Alkalilimnicola ehrlichii]